MPARYAGTPGDEADDARAEDENKDDGIANVIEALAEHYNEPYRSVLDWPWKLFCMRWRRLARMSYDRKREQEQREREQEDDYEMAALQAEHRRRTGGG